MIGLFLKRASLGVNLGVREAVHQLCEYLALELYRTDFVCGELLTAIPLPRSAAGPYNWYNQPTYR